MQNNKKGASEVEATPDAGTEQRPDAPNTKKPGESGRSETDAKPEPGEAPEEEESPT